MGRFLNKGNLDFTKIRKSEYVDKSCDSRALFEDLALAKLPSFLEHLNKYPAIYLDMTDFTTVYKNDKDIVDIIQRTIRKDVCAQYPDIVEQPVATVIDQAHDERISILSYKTWPKSPKRIYRMTG